MAGHGANQSKRKSKINPRVFKKVFSFKQHQQGAHSNLVASSTADAPLNNKRYSETANTVACVVLSSDESSTHDDTSTCSSTVDAEGVLIFLPAHRLTASSPPSAIFERIPGLRHGDAKPNRGDSFLSLGRRRNSSSSALPQAFQTRSPYQSKKSQKNLSATLKSCRSKSDAKFTLNNSAWERRQPTSMSRGGASIPFSFSKGSFITEERQQFGPTGDAGMDIVRTASSNSLFLPPEVSPAYKFIPIGCEEDYDDCSFDSEDYDICKERMNKDIDQSVAAATTVIVNTSSAPVPTSQPLAHKDINHSKESAHGATIVVNKSLCTGCNRKQLVDAAPSNVSTGQVKNDKYSHAAVAFGCSHHVRNDKRPQPSVSKYANSCNEANKPCDRLDLPPSPVSTDCTSRESNDLIGGKFQSKQKSDPRYEIDRICVTLEHQDEDWFPNIKQEIMKLSSIFTSNCSAASADTS